MEIFTKQKQSEFKNIGIDCSILTIGFWATSNLIQRVYGRFNINSGSIFAVKTFAGLFSTTFSLGLSHYFLQRSEIFKPKSPPSFIFNCNSKVHKNFFEDKVLIKQVLVGLLTFAALEQRSFVTMLPSSILVKGVYAKSMFMDKFSVASTSPIATEAQRTKIQRLGKLIGCHHCGSRQIFTKKGFIADHMPPTKFANIMNSKWWRKLLNMTVQQRLYPQCQKCYSIQGNAVRMTKHVPIYHFSFRLYHLAPALGLLLLLDKNIDNFFDDIAESCVSGMRRFTNFIQD